MKPKKSIKQCSKGYHDWKQIGLEGKFIKSKCSICKKDLISDPEDNEQWLKDHKRDYLQRDHKDYKLIYGDNKPFKKKKDPAWRRMKNWRNNPIARMFA